jgi:heavy metal efflux system protein
MVTALIHACLRYRWTVLLVTLAVVALGVWSFQQQQIDAYPDISAQMVQIITTYPGRAPEEVERQVTIPIERAMFNVPRVEVIRSRTIFGLSVVQLLFEEGVESYWARQRVTEKLGSLSLPDTARPDLGPLATAYGEVYRYVLTSDGTHNLLQLRELNDWVVIPRLLRTAGVADVSNFGGESKEYAVTLNPAQLQRYDISFTDVSDAVKSNNAAAGGSVVPRGSMSFLIRGRGAIETVKQIEDIFVKSVGGTPVFVRDVGAVEITHRKPLSGIFGKDSTPDGVEGIVLMRKGENPSVVLERVKAAVAELNDTGLPPGVKVSPFYDRTHLVESTLHTVTHSVLLGITLVVLVLLFFLGRPAMALLVALTIPFSLLFALILMNLIGIPIGLLSIGAIDFGIIVDGAVIMADNIAHRLGAAARDGERKSVWKTVLTAALEVERPLFVSMFMIIAAYLPLLTLTRIEGLLFRPMALTIVFALIGAILFSLCVVPVLATFLFRRGYTEWENPLLRWFRPIYAHSVEYLLRARWVVAFATVALTIGVCAYVFPRLGTEFLPHMDEGVMWVRANFPEGTDLHKTAQYADRMRQLVLEFKDIRFISTQTGRNDSGTDPFPPSRVESMIGPKPREEWTQFETKEEMVKAIAKRLRTEFPTTRFNFTQPIIDSVTEDTNGTSANLAVELSGPDMDVLQGLADRTVKLLKSVRGAVDVNIEQEGPWPQLVINPDRVLCARYNVRIDDITKLINNAIGGDAVSTLYEGERRFDIVVKFGPEYKDSPEAIGKLPVYNADGVPIPLAQVAHIAKVQGPTIIARENARRRLTVRCDISGRDQGGFVAEAQERFEQEIQVPRGYRVQWLGMFENLARARQHFAILIPLTVVVIFTVLMVSFGSLRAAFILLLPIPFAFVGGAVALYLRGMNLNVSTGVGFATLFGVAIMDGVLMFKGITTYRLQGASVDEAIVQGRLSRLRPILMTSLVAVLGLLPASLATGLGSDVQRPLATVIIWGLSSSTLLTLFVIPVFYRIFVPPLPQAASPLGQERSEFIEPLPDVSVPEVMELLEYLRSRGGENDIYRTADNLQKEFHRLTTIVKAAEMLGFVETHGENVVLTAVGQRLLAAAPDDRKEIWREQLLKLGLFREIYEVIRAQPGHVLDRDIVLETILMRMPYENYERIFNTFVRWARFADLFAYDGTTQRITLLGDAGPPAGH